MDAGALSICALGLDADNAEVICCRGMSMSSIGITTNGIKPEGMKVDRIEGADGYIYALDAEGPKESFRV